jgi:hypothetical protein
MSIAESFNQKGDRTPNEIEHGGFIGATVHMRVVKPQFNLLILSVTLLSLAILICGVVLLKFGDAGGTALSLPDGVGISTQSIGVVAICVGTLLPVLLFPLILKSMQYVLALPDTNAWIKKADRRKRSVRRVS